MSTTRGWNETRVLEECGRAFGDKSKVNGFYDYRTRLYFVGMFLTDADRLHNTPMGVKETPPWHRAQRIFGWGESWEEACHFLTLGKPMSEVESYVAKYDAASGGLRALIGPGGIVVPFDVRRPIVA